MFVSFTLAADFKFMRESFSENDHKWVDWPFGTVEGKMPASVYVASKFHLARTSPLGLGFGLPVLPAPADKAQTVGIGDEKLRVRLRNKARRKFAMSERVFWMANSHLGVVGFRCECHCHHVDTSPEGYPIVSIMPVG